MTTIAVPQDIAEALSKAKQPVRLIDKKGNVLGSFSPVQSRADELTPEELAELKRRLTGIGPWYTTEQVLAHIDSRQQGQ